MTETILYACKINEPDYMEEVIYQCKGYANKETLINKASNWAKENNYNRLRVSVINLKEPPNFKQTINLKTLDK